METATTNLPATTAMASPAPSTANLDLMTLPARLDDETLAMVEAVAKAPLAPLPPCSDGKFVAAMRYLASSLPSKAQDDLGGEMRINAYRRTLGGYSEDAISYLTGEALRTCKWFPTIAECIEIIGRWTRNDDALRNKRRAEVIARNERQARLDETMAALERGDLSGEQIAALPERFIDIGLTRGLIWPELDGTFRPRPLRRPTVLPADDGELSDITGQLAEKFPSERNKAA